MMSFLLPAGTEPFARLRYANLVLLGLMPAALLLARGGAEVIMAVIGLSFLWATVAERRWGNLAERTIAILLVTWLLLNLAVSPLALDPEISFSRSLLWLRFVIFFAATSTWLLRSRDDLKLLLVFWSITLALAMLDGYVQLVTGMSLTGNVVTGDRLSGPLERPNIGMFTARMGFPLLAMAFFLLASKGTASARRILPLTAFALVAFVFVILSGERTAAILTMTAILFGAGIVVLRVRRLRLYGLLLLAAVPVAFLLLYTLSSNVQARVGAFWRDIDNFWASPYGQIFRVAFGIWKRNPLTGSGMKNFQLACERAALPGLHDACYPHAHNIYLEWLSESGLVGFACFVIFVALLAWRVLRLTWTRPGQRLTGTALCGTLIVTLFPVAATQSFFSNWPAMVVWTALGVMAGVTRIAQQTAADKAA